MKLDHPSLVHLLQRAYSGEKAAAFAYVGHAGSLKNPEDKAAVKQIEDDEWGHRKNVLTIMQKYGIPISRYYEIKFHIIGKVISLSCYVIGWFMPYFFAGKLESGNVCEYFVMMHHFHSLGITDHDEILYEMGMKEKDHEIYFLNQIKTSKLLPIFEKVFSWGNNSSLNDVDITNKYTVEKSEQYCKAYKALAGK
jgi:rubrerythrin